MAERKTNRPVGERDFEDRLALEIGARLRLYQDGTGPLPGEFLILLDQLEKAEATRENPA